MNKDTAEMIEKLFAADTDDVNIVRGIFDMARREEALDVGRRARNLAAEKTRTHLRFHASSLFACRTSYSFWG